MARVMHFDLLVKEIKRAIPFYESAFGWKMAKWEGPMEYWMVTSGAPGDPGIDGGIGIGEPNMTGGQLTLGVDNVEEAVAKVTTAGGTVVQPKGPIEGIGWFALVGDTEGNVFGLMEDDAAAK